MIIRRRGLEEEQSAPTPSYEVHTVTTKCTNALACANYFKALGTDGAKGFFWIRDGASSIINNHLICYLRSGSSNIEGLRWRDNALNFLNSSRFTTSYDVIINVGDKILVVDFAYNSEIYCPSNMGVSVTEIVASSNCVNTQEVSNSLPSTSHSVVLPQTIEGRDKAFAFGVKGTSIVRMTGTNVIFAPAIGTSYDCYLSQNAPLWEIKYN